MTTSTTSLGPRSDFVRLIAKVQAGDEVAAQKLYERYGPVIVRAVRRRLHAKLRSKFDSIDFAQDVWASFFTNVIDKYDLNSPEQLVRLLTTMARNKVVETSVKTQRQKYDIQREDSLEGHHGGAENFPAVQQTPSQIVMGKEAWEQLLAQQPPVYRRILLLLREGQPPEIIAQDLRLSLRTVQRVIRKLLP